MTLREKGIMPQEVSSEAHSMIESGLASRKSIFKIQRSLREELGERVPRKIISKLKDARKKRLDEKHLFKKTGAKLVGEFLEKAREGEDVSHLQSVLEHAVYIDCLNRYSTDTEAFNDWSLKDVIKVSNDYKKMRSKGEQGEKLSGVLAAKLFDLVRSIFLGDAKLEKIFKQKNGNFKKEIENLVAGESFGSELEELEAMQSLYEKHVKKNSGGSDA